MNWFKKIVNAVVDAVKPSKQKSVTQGRKQEPEPKKPGLIDKVKDAAGAIFHPIKNRKKKQEPKQPRKPKGRELPQEPEIPYKKQNDINKHYLSDYSYIVSYEYTQDKEKGTDYITITSNKKLTYSQVIAQAVSYMDIIQEDSKRRRYHEMTVNMDSLKVCYGVVK